MSKARSVCVESGCPNVAVYRGRCELHRVRPWEGSYERRSAEGAIPSRKLREAVRRRARGRCERCKRALRRGGKYGGPVIGIVDHRVPHALGGATDEANLWLLCPRCDAEKTPRDLATIRSDDFVTRARGAARDFDSQYEKIKRITEGKGPG